MPRAITCLLAVWRIRACFELAWDVADRGVGSAVKSFAVCT